MLVEKPDMLHQRKTMRLILNSLHKSNKKSINFAVSVCIKSSLISIEFSSEETALVSLIYFSNLDTIGFILISVMGLKILPDKSMPFDFSECCNPIKVLEIKILANHYCRVYYKLQD